MTAATDPLGSVAQDPDVIRTIACKLVASENVCTAAQQSTTPSTVHRGGGGLPGVGTFLLWALLLVAIVVLLVVIVRVFLAGRGGRNRGSSASDDDTDDDAGEEDADEEVTGDEDSSEDAATEDGALAGHRVRRPSEWRAEAAAHRLAGRYRDALRCRYRALVGDLARYGVVDEAPGHTTGEERAWLREAGPEVADPFAHAADLFDEAWYGHADVGDVDDDSFIAYDRDVLQAVDDATHPSHGGRSLRAAGFPHGTPGR
ncbi:MAG: DUF4129 domain-containing protein [Ilumatobacteraceae bacterium]